MKHKQVGIKSKEDISKQSFSKPGSVQPEFHQSSRVQHYRNIGNQSVQRMLESRAIQAKLKIGSPNDKYEQEADEMADRVMKMEGGALVQRQPDEEEEELKTKPLLQRQVDEENEEDEEIKPKLMDNQQLQRQEIPDEEEEEELVQAKLMGTDQVQRQEEEPEEEEEEKPVLTKAAPGSTPEVSSGIESSINTMKGGGQPLSESTRSFFEPRFGADFSQVRVHNDSRAAQTAQAINAKAFTTGKDIAFNSGQYSPETIQGKHLLAHELTHVVQQSGQYILRRKTSNLIIAYTVKKGDNLWKIANRIGVPWKVLVELNKNNIPNLNELYPGDKVNVPTDLWKAINLDKIVSGPIIPQWLEPVKLYKVKKNDTLGKISRNHKVSIEILLLCNKDIKNRDKIKEGDIIAIPIKLPKLSKTQLKPSKAKGPEMMYAKYMIGGSLVAALAYDSLSVGSGIGVEFVVFEKQSPITGKSEFSSGVYKTRIRPRWIYSDLGAALYAGYGLGWGFKDMSEAKKIHEDFTDSLSLSLGYGFAIEKTEDLNIEDVLKQKKKGWLDIQYVYPIKSRINNIEEIKLILFTIKRKLPKLSKYINLIISRLENIEKIERLKSRIYPQAKKSRWRKFLESLKFLKILRGGFSEIETRKLGDNFGKSKK
jgi:LysM repeat protein